MLNRRNLLAGAAALAGAVFIRPAFAQDYPQRPVRVIVPYAPGGASDILARLIQPHLDRELGQAFIVDNRGGGASQVSLEGQQHTGVAGGSVFTTPGWAPGVTGFDIDATAGASQITVTARAS